MVAASSAAANSVQTGQSSRVASISAIKARTETAAVGVSSRLWPKRSTRREICGAANALVRVKAAATAPASQYSPWAWDSMVTMPIGAIAIGRRATNPAAANPLVPGARKISR